MEFIEMTGETLGRVMQDDELHHEDMAAAGVESVSIVRVNRQGDIEVRRAGEWDVIGGLIGDFEVRLKRETGLDWL